jgi:hypothetical protein
MGSRGLCRGTTEHGELIYGADDPENRRNVPVFASIGVGAKNVEVANLLIGWINSRGL